MLIKRGSSFINSEQFVKDSLNVKYAINPAIFFLFSNTILIQCTLNSICQIQHK